MKQFGNLIRGWRSLLRPFRSIPGLLHGTRRSAAALPDLVDAILVLPSIARRLEIITFQTATLVEMREELVHVRRHTAPLPHLDTQLTNVNEVLCRVDLNTQAVQQLADVVLPLHGAAARVGRLADRWPSRRVESRLAPSRALSSEGAKARDNGAGLIDRARRHAYTPVVAGPELHG